jgi:beta-lactam-binding protein with PASTA domain
MALPATNNTASSVPRVKETPAEPPEPPKAASVQKGTAPDNRTAIPNVSGQSLEEAVKTISGAGFEVAAIETRTSQQTTETALSTNPAAGVPANAASTASATATATATASPSAN